MTDLFKGIFPDATDVEIDKNSKEETNGRCVVNLHLETTNEGLTSEDIDNFETHPCLFKNFEK